MAAYKVTVYLMIDADDADKAQGVAINAVDHLHETFGGEDGRSVTNSFVGDVERVDTGSEEDRLNELESFLAKKGFLNPDAATELLALRKKLGVNPSAK